MKTKPFLVGLCVGAAVGFFLAYLYFVSVTLSGAVERVFGFVGGSIGIIAAVAYACRTYVEYLLGVEADQKKIRFSKTYELRAEAISEAHGKLLDLYDATNEFPQTGGTETGSPKWMAASNRIGEARNSLIDFLSRKQLYLPKETATKIRKLLQVVYGSHIHYTLLKEFPQPERSEEVKNWLKTKEQIPTHLAKLEADFRSALGFVD